MLIKSSYRIMYEDKILLGNSNKIIMLKFNGIHNRHYHMQLIPSKNNTLYYNILYSIR